MINTVFVFDRPEFFELSSQNIDICLTMNGQLISNEIGQYLINFEE